VTDRHVGRGCPRARQEYVTGRTRQVSCRGQRLHGFDMGPSSFPALQRVHGSIGPQSSRVPPA
jgi:hypothetical protein